ncbi:FadR family transcriptional regulator [Siminovitchia acidinfaciens]|uniref:FadR family transcriptional regulator n=1 Tax=Siminovitchia acidinfaciens TaxID=2321395 RepID=A0A429Y7M0_9BACI|nr:FadR/GntR family transcriptional regulator [Siminovitchia acidinfaciens]RST77421.1 FadR family transcriptional regulator [Siminovitchia acidinfaciens]
MNLKPIQKKRVYQEIIEQIQILIKKGDLKPGDKLPSERELAHSLSVSRNAVREAVSVLESAGIIEIFPGIGIFLIEDSNALILNRLAEILNNDVLRLSELLDIRQGIEGHGAYLAAICRTDSELEEIRKAYEGMKKPSYSKVEAIRDFHLAIAAATKNTTLLRIVDMLLESFSRDYKAPYDKNERQILQTEYYEIVQAIEGRDAEKAESLMKRHFVNMKGRIACL